MSPHEKEEQEWEGEAKGNDDDKWRILSDGKRIKITEALVFAVQRKSRTIDTYARMIIDPLLYANHRNSFSTFKDDSNNNKEARIQHETHHYFQPSTYSTEDDSREERLLRLNTGGPLYSTEELSLVCAFQLSVFSTLLSTSPPPTIAPYVFALVRLGIDGLGGGGRRARLVNRGVVRVCRELYGIVWKKWSGGMENMDTVVCLLEGREVRKKFWWRF